MSWNEMLYAYQKEKGGVFMGSRAADWDGELVLSYRDEPLIIRTVGESNGRYTTTSIRVRLAIHLERDYELRIRPKSAMSTGLNTVLGVLDRGLEKLPSGPDLHEDYGCPEVTRGRTITTTDRSFTKLVLRDLELRNALLASPKDGLLILPGPGGGGAAPGGELLLSGLHVHRLVLGADEYRAGLDGYRGGARREGREAGGAGPGYLFSPAGKGDRSDQGCPGGGPDLEDGDAGMIRRSGCGELRSGGA